MARRQWYDLPLVTRWRRRSPAVGIGVDAAKGFQRHRSGPSAALVAHYGFLSVFPLLLVMTTVLGYVLEGNPHLQHRIIDSALKQLPIIGQQISSDPSKLHGNAVVLVLGLATSLWAGMRAFVRLQHALDDIAEVPDLARPALLASRLRALIGVGLLGLAQIVTALSTGLVGVTGVRAISKVLLVVAAIVVNTVVLAAAYRWLCSARPPWRMVRPGAISAGVLFAGLQLVGTAVVGRAIAKASPVYGTFASVIGLLTWLTLHAVIALAGAELNAALAARRGADVTAPS